MYKIYDLSNRANDAILQSALDFEDLDLFGPMQGSSMTRIDLKMSEVIGETVEFER